MTTTPLDYFDKVPGTLEQLVLSTITQKLINRDYIHESLRTDFTTNAIDYNVTADSGDTGSIGAILQLSLTFPTLPFERQILVDADSFDRKIMSINSLNIDTLSLPQKPLYPLKSFPVQIPDYLDTAVPENILERRLIALCLHIRNVQNWIARWNICASGWMLLTYTQQSNIFSSLADVEATRDALLLELVNGIVFKPVPNDINYGYYPTGTSIPDNPGTAQEVIDFNNETTPSDSANNSSSPLSSSLLNDLQEAANNNDSPNNGFAPNSPEANNPQTQSEQNTLPDC